MKIILEDPDPYFIGILTKSISRKGYDICKSGSNHYMVAKLDLNGQSIIENMVIQLCEHHDRSYTIIRVSRDGEKV